VNQQDVFQIAITPPTIATDLVIVAGSEIADLNYLIGEPAVILDVPVYSIVPADADIWLDYTLDAGTPSFVSILQPVPGDFKVRIETASSASTGIYTISLTFHEQFSTLTRTTSFELTVSCVRMIDMLSSVSPALYYINDPFIDVIIPSYSLGPATCPYELTYSAALADGSPLPNAITLQDASGSHFLRLSETDPLATGVYSVRISVLDPKTSQTNTSLLIDVTVLCTKSISLVSNPIPAMTEYTINKS
jgi:hypothetical protein